MKIVIEFPGLELDESIARSAPTPRDELASILIERFRDAAISFLDDEAIVQKAGEPLVTAENGHSAP